VSYRTTILADTPSVYYRLGDASAPAVPDAGAGGVNAAMTGTVTFGQTGALAGDADTAVSFPATGTDYLQTATSPGAAYDLGDGPFSIEFWYKTNTSGVLQNPVSKGTGGYICRLQTTNKWILRKSGTGDEFVTTATFTDTTSWHHFVATKSGAGAQPHIYVDGVDQAGTFTTQAYANTTTGFAMGVDAAAKTTGPWNGLLDEVALYTSVLSQAQVTAHYQAGTAMFVMAVPHGGRYWRVSRKWRRRLAPVVPEGLAPGAQPGVATLAASVDLATAPAAIQQEEAGTVLAAEVGVTAPAVLAAPAALTALLAVTDAATQDAPATLLAGGSIAAPGIVEQAVATLAGQVAVSDLAVQQAIATLSAAVSIGSPAAGLSGPASLLVSGALAASGGGPSGATLTAAFSLPASATVLSPARLGVATALLANGASPAYRATVLGDSPSVYYRLGDLMAPAVPDPSAGGINAGLNGSVTFGQPGALAGDADTAVSFPGTGSNYLVTAASPGAAYDLGDGPFSIEFWYKAAQTGVVQDAAFKGVGAYLVQLNASNQWSLNLAGTGACFTTTASFADTATWHHVVVTRAAASQPHIYVDGVDQAGNYTARTFGNTTSTFIMGSGGGTTAPFGGLLDEVAIYKSVLTQAQVTAHYQAGLGPPPDAVLGSAVTLSSQFTVTDAALQRASASLAAVTSVGLPPATQAAGAVLAAAASLTAPVTAQAATALLAAQAALSAPVDSEQAAAILAALLALAGAGFVPAAGPPWQGVAVPVSSRWAAQAAALRWAATRAEWRWQLVPAAGRWDAGASRPRWKAGP
jgi:Concanavalin A-like lectin/glucanases superfamily